ncbi:MAG: hypothetical protein WBF47_28125 [Xanthobacteraceae bacterium]
MDNAELATRGGVFVARNAVRVLIDERLAAFLPFAMMIGLLRFLGFGRRRDLPDIGIAVATPPRVPCFGT